MRVFDFGANWQAFSEQRVDSTRTAIARQSLQSLLQREQLRGLCFLDVGCGSGLFSIAAAQLGAAKVIGVDINPRCITVSKANRDQLAPDAPISFHQGSALNLKEMQSLGTFDIVYAWGSLHHTGAMWTAIHNTARCVAPEGTFVLAIYNRHIGNSVRRDHLHCEVAGHPTQSPR